MCSILLKRSQFPLPPPAANWQQSRGAAHRRRRRGRRGRGGKEEEQSSKVSAFLGANVVNTQSTVSREMIK